MTAIVNGTVVTPSEKIKNGVILIEHDEILAVGGHDLSIPAKAERLDAAGYWVVPGLIDIHTHGMKGYDCGSSAVAQAIRSYPSVGVTSFLATTLTQSHDQLKETLRSIAEILAAPPAGAHCLGIHLEGPYLSTAQAGIANPEWFCPFHWQEVEHWQRAADNRIRLMTLAPERLDSLDSILKLKQAGILPSAGHTDATYEEMAAAIEAGIQQASHIFNAMRGFHHREPGAVGAILTHQNVFAEVIADGHHVHVESLRLLVQLKGVDRLILVSDSAPMAGLPEGKYSWAGSTIVVKDERCQLINGRLAGAYSGIDSGLRTMVNNVGLPLEQALAMATSTPATSLSLERKGRLAPGFDADIVWLNGDLQPILTIVGGEIQWSSL